MKLTNPIIALFVVAWTIMVLASPAVFAQDAVPPEETSQQPEIAEPDVDQPPRQIKFLDSIAAARTANEAIAEVEQKKTTVLYFGATWCKPCQQMKSVTLKSKRLAAKTDQDFQFVMFDVDDDVEVATLYAVSSVPTMIVLDAEKMSPIGRISGFVSDERLVDFLEEAVSSPMELPPTAEELAANLASADEAESMAALQTILMQFANPQRQDRERILEIFKRQSDEVVSNLLVFLHDSNLSIRAAASHVIEHRLGRRIGFDPFADTETRQQQIKAFEKTIVY